VCGLVEKLGGTTVVGIGEVCWLLHVEPPGYIGGTTEFVSSVDGHLCDECPKPFGLGARCVGDQEPNVYFATIALFEACCRYGCTLGWHRSDPLHVQSSDVER
jgi:hypothetical protein